MPKNTIKKQDYTTAKKALKRFSEKKEKDFELERVRETGGFLNRFNHKVTGEEFNELVSTLQNHLVAMNKTDIETVREFKKIYETFDALDKEYINAIKISIKTIEDTNDKLKIQQSSIDKLLRDQIITIKTLIDFKGKIEKLRHLSDIDNLWANVLEVQEKEDQNQALIHEIREQSHVAFIQIDELNVLRKRIEKIKNIDKIDKTYDSVENMQITTKSLMSVAENIELSITSHAQQLDTHNKFIDAIKAIKYLNEVDNLWERTNLLEVDKTKMNDQLERLNKQKKLHQESIETLNLFMQEIQTLKRIKEIDILWEQYLSTSKEVNQHEFRITSLEDMTTNNSNSISSLDRFRTQLSSYEHLRDVDLMWNREKELSESLDATNHLVSSHYTQINELEKQLHKTIQENDEITKKLLKRINIGYFMVGSSLAIAILSVFLWGIR